MTAIHDAESVDAGVRRLHHAYADVVMRRAWDDLDGLFAPGAPITLDLVTSPVQRFEGVTAFRSFLEPAMDRFAFLAFVIVAIHVDPSSTSERATSRLWFSEHRIDLDGGATQTYGLYRDELALAGAGAGAGVGAGSTRFGEWRFTRREYRTLARLPEGVVFPIPSTD